MPGIEATCAGKTVTGFNLGDRTLFDQQFTDPKTLIAGYSKKLFDFIDGLKNEKVGFGDNRPRSAFSCAETHALGLIIAKVGKQINLAEVEFGRPSSDSGQLLWEPCGNCSVWLEEAGGWGPNKTYKIRAGVLKDLGLV